MLARHVWFVIKSDKVSMSTWSGLFPHPHFHLAILLLMVYCLPSLACMPYMCSAASYLCKLLPKLQD